MSRLLLIFFFLILSCKSNLFAQTIVEPIDSAQQAEKRSREKTVSINMTPLLVMLMPFNKTNPFLVGPYNIAFKTYRNNRGWRFGLGANVNTLNQGTLVLNFRAGYEWRRPIYKRWYYTVGVDAMAFTGGLNLPENAPPNEILSVGAASVWGVEYYIHNRISLSTETSLILSYGEGELGDIALQLRFIPPIGLFLNVKFDKKKK